MKSVKQALLKTSPYEDYVQALGKAGLKETQLAKAWMEAGKQALNDSIIVTLPFTETGFFEGSVPQARSYRFSVYGGQVLSIKGQTKTIHASDIFADLFLWKDNHWQSLMHADSGLNITYEFDKEERCLLRIQPELLSDTWYSLIIASKPALINPVKGATNKSIGSFYGNDRDAGKRKHEGIDIFAPRGTPVVAPADGMVYSVGTNNLGGKVIWLYDMKRGQTYYFAHLDSQWVNAGKQLKQGDTLGQIGNTGNAQHTAPHLHFGIYRSGSIDPLRSIQTTPSISCMPLDTLLRSAVYKVSVKEALLHTSPDSKSNVLYTLVKDTYVKQLARSKNWSRIALPDGKQAFVKQNDISLADRGKRITLRDKDTLWSAANTQRLPVMGLYSSEVVELFARYKSFGYVKTKQNVYGWIKM
ncbi:MAG: M23 family metallopeptidase [Cytophagaceae bacterium]|nr:M23 family metallopeptidase [Cytophagaceae bacterium]